MQRPEINFHGFKGALLLLVARIHSSGPSHIWRKNKLLPEWINTKYSQSDIHVIISLNRCPIRNSLLGKTGDRLVILKLLASIIPSL